MIEAVAIASLILSAVREEDRDTEILKKLLLLERYDVFIEHACRIGRGDLVISLVERMAKSEAWTHLEMIRKVWPQRKGLNLLGNSFTTTPFGVFLRVEGRQKLLISKTYESHIFEKVWGCVTEDLLLGTSTSPEAKSALSGVWYPYRHGEDRSDFDIVEFKDVPEKVLLAISARNTDIIFDSEDRASYMMMFEHEVVDDWKVE